jgi:hypothetical protein
LLYTGCLCILMLRLLPILLWLSLVSPLPISSAQLPHPHKFVSELQTRKLYTSGSEYCHILEYFVIELQTLKPYTSSGSAKLPQSNTMF